MARLAGLKPDAGIDPDLYPIFSFAALLPWQLFQGALQRSSISLVANSNLLTKIYFPRLIIPFSAVAAGLVDFGFSFLVLVGLMLFYGVALSLEYALAAVVDAAGAAGGAGGGSVAVGAQRAVPRCAAHGALPASRSGCMPRRWPTRWT